jgi:3-deoxy-D-manno-octulosonic-acid transferase
MLVLAETEFWPNLLSFCFRRGIPVLVANGRISDRSWPRYWRLRSVWRPFLSRLSRVLAQTGLDAERLLALGCERVTVSGNLKFDVRVSQPARATALLGALRGPLQLLVAGSTLEGEEALLLEAWPAVCGMPAESPAPLAMVIAPRHPERFPAVAALLAQSGHPWRRVSALGREPLRAGELLLLDSIGELASVYSLAAVAFVGGSLVNGGGHNPLEPAQFAVPVVMGPHFANFRAIVEAMRAADAIEIVKPEALERQLAGLLRDSGRAAALGQRGRAVFAAQTGATARTVAAIGELLGESGR